MHRIYLEGRAMRAGVDAGGESAFNEGGAGCKRRKTKRRRRFGIRTKAALLGLFALAASVVAGRVFEAGDAAATGFLVGLLFLAAAAS